MAVEAFNPGKPGELQGAPLLDLNRYPALKMTVKGDYLFIEAGGFSDKYPVGWKSPLVVMKRTVKKGQEL